METFIFWAVLSSSEIKIKSIIRPLKIVEVTIKCKNYNKINKLT